MANGKGMKGTQVGNEYIYKQGLADPRDAGSRALGLVNRVLSGNTASPVRRYDDTPEQMAAKRAKSKK